MPNPSNPFSYPPSEIIIDINKINDFWREINYNYTDHSDQIFDPDYRPLRNWGPYDENGNWNYTKYPIVIIPL